MSKVAIVTDSNSGITQKRGEENLTAFVLWLSLHLHTTFISVLLINSYTLCLLYFLFRFPFQSFFISSEDR